MYRRDQAFAVWRRRLQGPMFFDMTTPKQTIQSIAKRHFADDDEGGRTCHGCGRPWPCDVRKIVVALAVTLEPTARGAASTNGTARRAPAGTRPRSRQSSVRPVVS